MRELKVYSSSRGRPGRLVWFDPACELRWSGAALPPAAAALERDLAGVLVALCRADDVLLAPRPSLAHLEVLQRAGFALPRVRRRASGAAHRRPCPGGWTPAALERARGLELQTPPPDLAGWGACFAKPWAAALWRELPGVRIGADRLPRDRPGPGGWRGNEGLPGGAVVKAPYGASGAGSCAATGRPGARAFGRGSRGARAPGAGAGPALARAAGVRVCWRSTPRGRGSSA
ncbi:MAG: hypothetical protein R3F62_31310 [Planctomycetota bacterium]